MYVCICVCFMCVISLYVIDSMILGQFDGHFDDFSKLAQWTTQTCYVEFSGESGNQLENTNQ